MGIEKSKNSYSFPEIVLGNYFRKSNCCASYPPAILNICSTRYLVILYYLNSLIDLTSEQVLLLFLLSLIKLSVHAHLGGLCLCRVIGFELRSPFLLVARCQQIQVPQDASQALMRLPEVTTWAFCSRTAFSWFFF